MSKKVIVVAIVVILAAAAALVLLRQRGPAGQPSRMPQEAPDVLPLAQRPVQDPATILITVNGGAFIPSRINARVGDTVEWENVGTAPARIVGDEVSSPELAPGQVHRVVLAKAGTIQYRNVANPESRTGTLVVAPAP